MTKEERDQDPETPKGSDLEARVVIIKKWKKEKYRKKSNRKLRNWEIKEKEERNKKKKC